jgi:hypothetical protein
MRLKRKRVLLCIGLLFLMFGAGLTLVRVFRRQQHPPPPVIQSRQRSMPEEVVATYWALSREGRMDEAAKYLSWCFGRGGIMRTDQPNNGWASAIYVRKMRLVSFDREAVEDNEAVVFTTAALDASGDSTFRMRHELCMSGGEWKISSIALNSPRYNLR